MCVYMYPLCADAIWYPLPCRLSFVRTAPAYALTHTYLSYIYIATRRRSTAILAQSAQSSLAANLLQP